MLHRKMIFNTQRIFKCNMVILYHDFSSWITYHQRRYLTYEYLPTYDMRFVLFNRLSVAEGLHDIGENRRWKSGDYILSEIERSYMLQWKELSWQKICNTCIVFNFITLLCNCIILTTFITFYITWKSVMFVQRGIKSYSFVQQMKMENVCFITTWNCEMI